MATVPGTMKRPAYAPLKVFPAPRDHARGHDADCNATRLGRRRKTVDAGIGRHFGQPGDPRRPISPAWLGLEAATTAIPGRRPSHNDARKKSPPRGGAFLFQRKVNDQANASDAGTASASRRLADLGRLRLKLVQICHGALRMRGRGKDEALVVGQHVQ